MRISLWVGNGPGTDQQPSRRLCRTEDAAQLQLGRGAAWVQVATYSVSTASISNAAAISCPGIGMPQALEDLLRWAVLDHLAVAHHDDLIAQRAHHAQVVTDEHVGQPAPRLQIAQQSTICACTDMSSAEVGSSSTTKLGSSTIARAMLMRCRCRRRTRGGSGPGCRDRARPPGCLRDQAPPAGGHRRCRAA